MNQDLITTRREFLHRGLTLVGAGATVPAFINSTASAIGRTDDAPLTATSPGQYEQRVLVIVQLAGGNDGLNTLVPFRDDDYYRARKRIAVDRKDLLQVSDELGLHPAAAGLKSLYDEGLLAMVQGVGYPNPNRSHFKSTDIWASARPDGRTYDGWVGRYFDAMCDGQDPAPPDRAICPDASPWSNSEIEKC